MKYLALVLTLLFIVVACGKSEPTMVPTFAMPTIGSPPPTATSPPPTWTPEPTHTPWPSKTPTPGLVITTTGEAQICDGEMLRMYIGAVAQIEAANLSLEQQEFEESAVLAAIPGLEQLLTRVNEFPTPCENALWLRQMLTFELGTEIDKLEDSAAGRLGSRSVPIDYTLIDRLEVALAALRQAVEQAAAPPGSTPTLPPASWDCSGDLYDCPYFFSQAEAQQCYDYCLPKAGDIHRLDEDGDGVVCPSLP
jgi:hypothetical protein